MKRIGLYGGTFDPFHNAHLALARLARDHLGLDELRILPAGAPWQKVGRVVATPAQRAEMVALAIAGERGLALEPHELRQPGPTYTVDTVRALQAREAAAGGPAEWFYVMGQDQYARLETWREWRTLLALVTLAVAARAGERPAAGAEVAAQPHRLVELPLPAMPVSSSDVRARLARGGPIVDMVPPPVAGYIDRTHLYRS